MRLSREHENRGTATGRARGNRESRDGTDANEVTNLHSFRKLPQYASVMFLFFGVHKRRVVGNREVHSCVVVK